MLRDSGQAGHDLGAVANCGFGWGRFVGEGVVSRGGVRFGGVLCS